MVSRDIEPRTFRFVSNVLALCRPLRRRDEQIRHLALATIKAATSVGANLEEAAAGQSRADFLSKCSIALKEARETLYWLRLLAACVPEAGPAIGSLAKEANELVAILSAIVRNARSSTARR